MQIEREGSGVVMKLWFPPRPPFAIPFSPGEAIAIGSRLMELGKEATNENVADLIEKAKENGKDGT